MSEEVRPVAEGYLLAEVAQQAAQQATQQTGNGTEQTGDQAGDRAQQAANNAQYGIQDAAEQTAQIQGTAGNDFNFGLAKFLNSHSFVLQKRFKFETGA